MEQNEKARYNKWFPFTTYDLDELNNRDMHLTLEIDPTELFRGLQ